MSPSIDFTPLPMSALRLAAGRRSRNELRRRRKTSSFREDHLVAVKSTLIPLGQPLRVSSTQVKPPPAREASAATRSPKRSHPNAYLTLAKARLSGLVVTTTAAGFVATGNLDALFSTPTFVGCCVGTALCSSSAAAVNQIVERHRDARMKRTRNRPLVTGALSVPQAVTAASVAGVAGPALLAVTTDPVTTALGVGNMVLYAGVYTYMKPRSVANTWVGAIVGAVPPVMGVTAATGGWCHPDALVLGATLYLWQLPHFFALSHMYREDYRRGGFRMHPRPPVLRQAMALSTIPLLTTAANLTSSMFAVESLALNAYWLYVVQRFAQQQSQATARKVFLTSLWYLPVWLTLYLLHSKVWDATSEQEEVVTDEQEISLFRSIQKQVLEVRAKGRAWCVHEHQKSDTAACPITLTRKATSSTVNLLSNVTAAKSQEDK